MPVPRRLTALVAASSLTWSALVLGVALPAARAAAGGERTAYDGGGAQRAPHDPATYYAGTEGLSGAHLAARLNTIIRGHTTVSYATVFAAMGATDRDPANAANVIDFYSGTSVPASNKCQSSCPSGSWNREHTWPQSKGVQNTNPGPGTDLHHMRPEFATTNSSRGNLDFDETSGGTVPLCAVCTRDADSFEPRDAVKGDLARGLFYMAVRYEGGDGWLDLKLNDRTCNEGGTNLGRLSTLVAWSLADPPDAAERARNDLVDGDYQHNRNPFIDHPEWVTSIFGDGVGAGPACGSTSGSEYVAGGTTPANRPPTTSPVTASTTEDAATTVPLVASDPDGDPLTWSVTAAPAHGTASVSGSTLTYTPDAGFSGDDRVGVTVADGRGGTAATTVSITVTPDAATPVNSAPSVSPAQLQAVAGTPVTTTLVAQDPDGDPVAITAATATTHGTVSYDGLRLTYTPTSRSGSEGFTVTVSDDRGATATARVTVHVAARTAALTASTPAARRGSPVVTTVAVTGSGDAVPTGTVTLRTGDTALGTARVGPDGTATVRWTPRLAGAVEVAVSYGGDGLHAPATSPASRLTVARSASRLAVTGGPLRRGRASVVTVTVRTVAGAAATGRVALTVGGRRRTATLARGTARVRIARLPRTATVRVTARYAGDRRYAAGSASRTFTLRR